MNLEEKQANCVHDVKYTSTFNPLAHNVTCNNCQMVLYQY